MDAKQLSEARRRIFHGELEPTEVIGLVIDLILEVERLQVDNAAMRQQREALALLISTSVPERGGSY